ncbi:MAG: hypothetical protein CM15mP46_7440 [Alphaproteobacteria bacterium]|nr:MAG: hypothetical protein CM15mP46_7440 [Alphaproteobacteria bacterium]
MGKAAKHLDTPVVSGNVSLYNETDGVAIRPCPVVGMVGVIDDVTMAVGNRFVAADEEILFLGQDDSQNDGWLGASLYAAHQGIPRSMHRHQSILMPKNKQANCWPDDLRRNSHCRA